MRNSKRYLLLEEFLNTLKKSFHLNQQKTTFTDFAFRQKGYYSVSSNKFSQTCSLKELRRIES
jgi:hypothetical protein